MELEHAGAYQLNVGSDRLLFMERLHKTFALDDVVSAHRLMESSAHIGKIMLKVGA